MVEYIFEKPLHCYKIRC